MAIYAARLLRAGPRDDYTMVIDNGKVEATIIAEVYDSDPSMRETLHGALNARFLAVQLLNRSPFELWKPSMVRVHEDGRRDIFVELEPVILRISGGSVDFQVTDQNGNIISDSRRDRIDRKRGLADLISAHSSDGLLTAWLASHQNSVLDPDNELVHLYEIRDALAARFGGDKGTRIGVSAKEWSRLGQLCNDEPLRQGRHRGNSGTALRDATHSELEEARTIARSMIEKYSQWLDEPRGSA